MPKEKVTMTNWIVKGLNSTVLVSSSDTAFAIQRAPIPERTIFYIKPQARRISLVWCFLNNVIWLIILALNPLARRATVDTIISKAL